MLFCPETASQRTHGRRCLRHRGPSRMIRQWFFLCQDQQSTDVSNWLRRLFLSTIEEGRISAQSACAAVKLCLTLCIQQLPARERIAPQSLVHVGRADRLVRSRFQQDSSATCTALRGWTWSGRKRVSREETGGAQKKKKVGKGPVESMLLPGGKKKKGRYFDG